MSLMEGFSDWVMDEVGAELIPDVASIRRRFETRRGQRRRGIDRILARLTGMDLKLEQYRRGERFVAGVHAAGGSAAIAHLWDGPETLPNERELDDPAAWVARVMPAADALAVGRAGGRCASGEDVTPTMPRRTEPAAIALTPILSARYREEDLARIRAAGPRSPTRERLAGGPLRQPAR